MIPLIPPFRVPRFGGDILFFKKVGIASGVRWECVGSALGVRRECAGSASGGCRSTFGRYGGVRWECSGSVLRECCGSALRARSGCAPGVLRYSVHRLLAALRVRPATPLRYVGKTRYLVRYLHLVCGRGNVWSRHCGPVVVHALGKKLPPPFGVHVLEKV